MTFNRRAFVAGLPAFGMCLASTNLAADTLSGFRFSFPGFDGKPLLLNRFQGRVVLVVNTASECVHTGQYGGLEKLWRDYKDKGLTVVGVPSNNFGGQEPLTGEKIKNFCTLNYGVTFPLTDRTDVVGRNAHPFYRWAVKQAGDPARPRWNFHKILLNRKGEVSATFASAVLPDNDKLRRAIYAALGIGS